MSQEEFRKRMDEQRKWREDLDKQRQSAPGSDSNSPSRPREDAPDARGNPTTEGWGDSSMTRPRYNGQESGPNTSPPPASGYDDQGNYRDGRTRENRTYSTDGSTRPIGRYDYDGNRADSPRNRYDAQGNYTNGQTRQNRVYYGNESRPVGSGGAARQYEAIKRQSDQRVDAIRNSGSSNRSAPAPAAVPFPTASPTPTPTPSYTPSPSSPNTSSSGNSGGTIVFDDNAPRRSRFGYDESAEKTPAVTPRQSGSSSRGASMRLP